MKRARQSRFEEMIRYDRTWLGSDVRLIAGVDEAGRGALAGPVVAAAVICEPCQELCGVRDSKLLCENEREHLYELLIERSVSWGVGIVEAEEIDKTNILRATLKAMRIAVEALHVEPDLVLVDGNRLPELSIPAKEIVRADRKSFVVAAASILAKVTRDRIMKNCAALYRGYGFSTNKGYATREHIEAIRSKGRTRIHRLSFRVREQMRLELSTKSGR